MIMMYTLKWKIIVVNKYKKKEKKRMFRQSEVDTARRAYRAGIQAAEG